MLGDYERVPTITSNTTSSPRERQMEAIDRASERVDGWPQWKKDSATYRPPASVEGVERVTDGPSNGECRGYIEVALHALRDSRVQFAPNQKERDKHILKYQDVCAWLRERGIEVGI